MAQDGKRITHANVAMFGGEVMLLDEFSEHEGDVLAPTSGGRAHLAININLPQPLDVDTVIKRAADAGATVTFPAATCFGARAMAACAIRSATSGRSMHRSSRPEPASSLPCKTSHNPPSPPI